MAVPAASVSTVVSCSWVVAGVEMITTSLLSEDSKANRAFLLSAGMVNQALSYTTWSVAPLLISAGWLTGFVLIVTGTTCNKVAAWVR